MTPHPARARYRSALATLSHKGLCPKTPSCTKSPNLAQKLGRWSRQGSAIAIGVVFWLILSSGAFAENIGIGVPFKPFPGGSFSAVSARSAYAVQIDDDDPNAKIEVISFRRVVIIVGNLYQSILQFGFSGGQNETHFFDLWGNVETVSCWRGPLWTFCYSIAPQQARGGQSASVFQAKFDADAIWPLSRLNNSVEDGNARAERILKFLRSKFDGFFGRFGLCSGGLQRSKNQIRLTGTNEDQTSGKANEKEVEPPSGIIWWRRGMAVFILLCGSIYAIRNGLRDLLRSRKIYGWGWLCGGFLLAEGACFTLWLGFWL